MEIDKRVVSVSGDTYDYLSEQAHHLEISLHKHPALLKRIREVSPFDFLVYNLSTYPSTYLKDLLVSLPFLWRDITAGQIKDLYIILSSGRKYEGVLALTSFLSKYLELDAIDLYKNTNVGDLSLKNSIITDNINEQLPYGVLYKTSIDMLVIENSGIDLKEFMKLKERFLKEGVKPIAPFIVTREKSAWDNTLLFVYKWCKGIFSSSPIGGV